MHAIGIAQTGQRYTLGQQCQHFSDTWETTFGPIPEVIEERLWCHSEPPFCHDASGKCLWRALPRFKGTYPGRGCEPELPHLFLEERLPKHPLQRRDAIDFDQYATQIKENY